MRTHRVTGIVLALACVGVTLAESPGPPPPPLQPAVYHSPSGEFALDVRPSERDGSGPADYRLTRAGEVVWTGELPFTFRDAVVLDDGEVGGAAYSEGHKALGQIVFAVLDLKGVPRWQSEHERYSGRGIHSGPEPFLRGVHTQGDGSTITLRLASLPFSSENELWWVHEWASGELLFNHSPYRPENPDWHGSREARAVPGTPLALSLWSGPSDHHHVILTNPEGAAVWELALARSPLFISGFVERRGPRILAVADGQFELGLIAPTTVRVTYRVQREEGPVSIESRWKVQEIGQEPWLADVPPVEPATPLLERTALELLGEIHLDFAALEPEPGSNLQPIGRIRHRAVDLEGRIYVTDGLASAVYVFDPNGKGRCVARPEPLDFAESLDLAWLTATSTGRIALGRRHPSRIVEFDEACERIGVVELPRSTGRWSFVPGSTKRWMQVWSEELQIVDSDGLLVERVRKCPNGDWLDDLQNFAVAPDGSLAVVTRHEAHFYDESGRAIRTVPIPLQEVEKPGFVWWSIAYGANDLWLKQGTSLLRVPSSGFPPSYADLHPDAIGQVFAGANAEELLVFTGERERVLRFALPREDD